MERRPLACLETCPHNASQSPPCYVGMLMGPEVGFDNCIRTVQILRKDYAKLPDVTATKITLSGQSVVIWTTSADPSLIHTKRPNIWTKKASIEDGYLTELA